MLDLLKMLWRPTEKALKFVGKVQSTILLSGAYFLIIGPIAILLRLIKVFQSKINRRSYWKIRSNEAETEITLRRQF